MPDFDPVTNPGRTMLSYYTDTTRFLEGEEVYIKTMGDFFSWVTDLLEVETTSPFPSAPAFAAYSEQYGDPLANWSDVILGNAVSEGFEPLA